MMEEFVKLPSAFPSLSRSKFSRGRYLILIMAMAESPASCKYDVEKGISILSVLFTRAFVSH